MTTTTPMPGTAERVPYLLTRPVVSIDEAIEITGLSRSTIRRAIDRGDLTVNRIGGRVLLPTANLLEFVGADQAVA